MFGSACDDTLTLSPPAQQAAQSLTSSFLTSREMTFSPSSLLPSPDKGSRSPQIVCLHRCHSYFLIIPHFSHNILHCTYSSYSGVFKMLAVLSPTCLQIIIVKSSPTTASLPSPSSPLWTKWRVTSGSNRDEDWPNSAKITCAHATSSTVCCRGGPS